MIRLGKDACRNWMPRFAVNGLRRMASGASQRGEASRSNGLIPATLYSSDSRSRLERSLDRSILLDLQDSRQDVHPWDRNHRIRNGTQTRRFLSGRVSRAPDVGSLGHCRDHCCLATASSIW